VRVRQAAENRLYWSLGRGDGDDVLGVELFLDMKGHVKRTTFSRGKFGKERIILEEEYSVEEFLEILDAGRVLLYSICDHGHAGTDAKLLLLEAIDRIRRAYDEF